MGSSSTTIHPVSRAPAATQRTIEDRIGFDYSKCSACPFLSRTRVRPKDSYIITT